MLAGFSFGQLLAPLPDKHEPGYTTQLHYFCLTAFAFAIELLVIIGCTYLSNWGPGLALRGAHGGRDLHRAVSALKEFQLLMFSLFIAGWICFFASSLFQLWIYFPHIIAEIVLLPYSLFLVAILWYVAWITWRLKLPASESVEGKMDILQPYEEIGDIDAGIHRGRAGSGGGFAPIIEERTEEGVGGWFGF